MKFFYLLLLVVIISCNSKSDLPDKAESDDNSDGSYEEVDYNEEYPEDHVSQGLGYICPDEKLVPEKSEKHLDDIYIFQNTVSAGDTHTCSTIEGVLYCWGWNYYGELGIGKSGRNEIGYSPERIGKREDWSFVEIGERHSCAIASGELYCWGLNSYGQLGNGISGENKFENEPQKIGSKNNWEYVSAGTYHTCGIESGALYCWGWNEYGQLGTGNNDSIFVPQKIGERSDWKTVSAGFHHTCGIAGEKVFCWGKNTFGELGDESNEDKNYPVEVALSKNWSVVSAGFSYTCGISGGELFCWGRNNYGQLGTGEKTTPEIDHNRNSPVKVMHGENGWKHISVGISYSCGINNGKIYCWGSSNNGGLGLGSSGYQSYNTYEPTEVYSDKYWGKISTYSHSCAITKGNLYCWGNNSYFQVGESSGKNQYSPVRVVGRVDWSHISTGGASTCGIAGGKLYCWGYNYYGQLGNGKSGFDTIYDTPQMVDNGDEWKAVTTGGKHSCGIRMASTSDRIYDPFIFCWGRNNNCQVNDSYCSDEYTWLFEYPSWTQWDIHGGWTGISAGYNHTCAILKGELYCWGSNTSRQIGTGRPINVERATRIGFRDDWEYVSGGFSHTCGIAGGELFCWGSNLNGETGTGSSHYQIYTPAKVGERTDWQVVSTGLRFSCGIAGGDLFCWGSNAFGKLGNNENCGNFEDWECERENKPVKVLSEINNWEKVSTGDNHACAIAEGELYCWGKRAENDYEITYTSFPVKIEGIEGWTEISCGLEHTCGIAKGETYCWGNNEKGQLGIGSTDNVYSPQLVEYPLF